MKNKKWCKEEFCIDISCGWADNEDLLYTPEHEVIFRCGRKRNHRGKHVSRDQLGASMVWRTR